MITRTPFFAAALAFVFLLGGSLAYAEQGPPEDGVSAADRANYQALNIEGRFGVHFKAHKSVCAEAGAGTARCAARVITDAAGRPAATLKAVSGFSPSQILGAYGLSGTVSGLPIIGIVDAYDDPTIVSDLATYNASSSIPALPTCTTSTIASSPTACFLKVNQLGATTSPPTVDAGWALETSLDVEIAHGLCQNCKVLLVEASSASYSDLLTAVDKAVALGAKIVSNSWASGEFRGETTYDTHFSHPGIAFLFASGDSGYGTAYPAASRYVTSVGGTSLFLNGNGSYNQELAWSGTGSGCSSFEGKPSWQHDAKCARRTLNDVAAVADPNTGAAIYDSTPFGSASGWFEIGGTSLATPVLAAVYALASPLPTGTQENSLPYFANLSTTLHDIMSGANGRCGSASYLCTAVTGYDGPTGLGTPKGTGAF
ncbi:S53 family peptidase [Candidatus Kaiserbacteria bacterium]|nr:S53 family peptidase [Candidatus Kaiserbacteria bacterium]